MRVVKEEDSFEISGSVGFLSPQLGIQEYNMERNSKRFRKLFEVHNMQSLGSPPQGDSVVLVEGSELPTSAAMSVPLEKEVIVPKVEKSVPVVDLVSPEDGSGKHK